jgi:hypothetical protein
MNCIGTGTTCGTGKDALGQSYWISANYCTAVGTPGTDSTYTAAMATAAGAAAPQPTTCDDPPCVGISSCTTSTTAQDAYYVDLTSGSKGPCVVWVFKTTGSGTTKAISGYVHSDTTGCYCPTSTDPTWD